MPSGRPLTETQKEKIRKEIRYKSKCQLAQELGLHYQTVSKFVKKESLEDEPESED